ncbi:hypothetical protein BD309DRAFT_481291 [Dichomitus squalens]|uniref:Uncharacterized protein n=1 Tax=Dichomitus squalens TaxID=114155 RepID=A0A4V2K6B0_9APHY|nr:hypothetical protein BD309DRAFT_481291 [Dichomitus squalens]TBU51563.1 hypothetical protein BD310DRAFT_334905 [Dichomitus squalens]
MFHSLPYDVSLHILSYLSLNDLHNVELVSPAAHSLFLAHEESIYHQAAIYHGFVTSRTLFEGATAFEGPWLSEAGNWKDIYRLWCILKRQLGRARICARGRISASESG